MKKAQLTRLLKKNGFIINQSKQTSNITSQNGNTGGIDMEWTTEFVNKAPRYERNINPLKVTSVGKTMFMGPDREPKYTLAEVKTFFDSNNIEYKQDGDTFYLTMDI